MQVTMRMIGINTTQPLRTGPIRMTAADNIRLWLVGDPYMRLLPYQGHQERGSTCTVADAAEHGDNALPGRCEDHPHFGAPRHDLSRGVLICQHNFAK